MTRRTTFLGRCPRAFIVAALAVLVSQCGRRPGNTEWSFESHAGIAFAAGDRSCLSISAASLTANTKVYVLEPANGRHTAAVIVAPRDECAGVSKSDSDLPLQGYEIRLETDSDTKPGPGIAIVASSDPFHPDSAGVITADLDADTHRDYFRSCTSSEGVHFTIWTDAPLTGTRRWHRYYYLGYDVDPTCTAAESSGP